ncbi:hypothetical protein [Paenibacillus sp. F411]|uniref:hypothetical protein n=1 Tax=Paenibacillus sp. F411 TaxID=2820239 RepID=UPI003267C188
MCGAGLDVFEHETVSLNHPLLTLSNVVALSHIISASIRKRKRMAQLAVENVRKGLLGQTPAHWVIEEAIRAVRTSES